jgi:hypothetical protein
VNAPVVRGQKRQHFAAKMYHLFVDANLKSAG